MSLWVNKTSRYIGKRITENFWFPVWSNAVLIQVGRGEKRLPGVFCNFELSQNLTRYFTLAEDRMLFSCSSLSEWDEIDLHGTSQSAPASSGFLLALYFCTLSSVMYT